MQALGKSQAGLACMQHVWWYTGTYLFHELQIQGLSSPQPAGYDEHMHCICVLVLAGVPNREIVKGSMPQAGNWASAYYSTPPSIRFGCLSVRGRCMHAQTHGRLANKHKARWAQKTIIQSNGSVSVPVP